MVLLHFIYLFWKFNVGTILEWEVCVLNYKSFYAINDDKNDDDDKTDFCVAVVVATILLSRWGLFVCSTYNFLLSVLLFA